MMKTWRQCCVLFGAGDVLVPKGKLKDVVLAFTKKEKIPDYQALISNFGFPQGLLNMPLCLKVFI